jgi:hypothetical protein
MEEAASGRLSGHVAKLFNDQHTLIEIGRDNIYFPKWEVAKLLTN